MFASANFLNRFKRNVRVDRFGAISGQHTEMVHFARFAGFHDKAGLHPQALPHKVMMHRSRCQQSRHCNAIWPLLTICQDKDVVIGQHRIGRGPAHFFNRQLQPFDTAFNIPCRVDIGTAECTIQRGFNRADFGQILISQDRLFHLKAFMRAGGMAQQIGARADHGKQAHHQLFTDWVNRRVCDLRKVLFEIIIQQARFIRQHCNGRISAHRTDRIIPFQGHRFQEFGDVFLRVTKGLLRFEQRGRFLIFVLRQFGKFWINPIQIVQLILRLFQPFAIGRCFGQLTFQLGIFDDSAFFKVNQQHLARLKPPFARDVIFIKGQNAAFRSEADNVILGHTETCRAQAIAIQSRANLTTIGKAYCCRAIPWLHQSSVIFIKSAAAFIHQRIAAPCLWHQHHHRMSKRISTRQQQFERIIKAGRIRLTMRNDWPDLVEIRPQQITFHCAAARIHPVHIAANCVDFAIMRDQAERMRQTPAWECVG